MKTSPLELAQLGHRVTTELAATSGPTDVHPIIWVLGVLAVIVVATLGPLSRLHERRDERRQEAARTKAASTSESTGTDEDGSRPGTDS